MVQQPGYTIYMKKSIYSRRMLALRFTVVGKTQSALRVLHTRRVINEAAISILRGEKIERDEPFVSSFCQKCGIPPAYRRLQHDSVLPFFMVGSRPWHEELTATD